MQVSVESTGNLSRKMTVELPSEKIDQEIAKRLADMSRRVRLKGFRPGKAPLKVVRQHYGARVQQEVMNEFMQSSYQEAITKESLRPAGGPSIKPEVMAEGEGLKYVAEFEVYPEVDISNLAEMEIKRPTAEVSDDDLEKMMVSLQKQRAEWSAVDREAQTGDRVVIDYEGKMGGEAFPNNTAKDFTVEIGAKRWLEEFENQLIGVKAGDQKNLEVTYPEGTQPENLAGKAVTFEVTVKSVNEAKLPEIDDAFAKMFGIEEGGVEALRTEIRANMERELKQRSWSKLRDRVMNALHERYPIELPSVLVNHEIENVRKRIAESGGEAVLAKMTDEQVRSQAERRVALGVVIGEVARQNQLKVDGNKVRENIEMLAASYEEPSKVVDYYYSNPQARASVESMVLEQQVVDWIMEKATVIDEPSSFDELVRGQAVA